MLSLILLAAAPAVGAAGAKPACRGALPSQVDATQRAKVRPLGSEPPARPIHTVMRTEDGCTRPLPVARLR